MEEAREVPVGGSRRSQRCEEDRVAMVENVAKVRADRERKEGEAVKAPAVDLFWPSGAENDARLFDDESGESCGSKNTEVPGAPEHSRTVTGTDGTLHGRVPGRSKALHKRSSGSAKPAYEGHSGTESLSMSKELAAAGLIELPSDSGSHISISDDDNVDDTLCSKLGSVSLNISTSRSDTTDYGSAKSTLGSSSAGAQQQNCIDLEDDETPATSLASTDSSQWKESSKGMILRVKGKEFTLPVKLFTKLYNHQREGVRWLWGLHVRCMGGILGDDMGLGKTMQIAAFLFGLFSSGLIKRALIVAPKTLIPHWEGELTVVGLGGKVKDYSGTSISVRESNLRSVFKAGGVLLTTYDIVRHNAGALGRVDENDTVAFDYVILDEGHLIKNPSTQRAISLGSIPSDHRIIISGTPIQNNLREMWALYNFCCPTLLGDRKEFKKEYEDLIFKGNDKHATDRQKRIGSAAAQELRDRIAPYFLRRLKSDVFPSTGVSSTEQLAKKNDMIVWLRLSQRQRQMYTAFLNSQTVEQSVEGSALAALTVLKKICDHPLLLTKRAADDVLEGMECTLDTVEAEEAEKMRAGLLGFLKQNSQRIESQNEDSCKIVFLLALLDNLVQAGHRTLIFAQTLKMLDFIQEELTRRKYCFCRIDGKTKAADRKKIVEDFQRSARVSIFLLTSQVGGLGLTLTGADRVVIVDPAWNPSKDNQSVDRAYRIGQVKDVIVYRLMTCGTLEEKIYRKQVFKGGLMKLATEEKEQFRYFSQQELRELFTVPKTGFDISVTQQQLYEEHAHQMEVDEDLAKHIKFLKRQGIAGVSHHDLLFSKAAPELPPAPEDEAQAGSSMLRGIMVEDMLNRRAKPVENFPSGIEAVLNLQSNHRKERADPSKDRRRSLEQQMERLSSLLRDTSFVRQLPDSGERLRKKVKELQDELKALPDASVNVDSFSSVFDKLNI